MFSFYACPVSKDVLTYFFFILIAEDLTQSLHFFMNSLSRFVWSLSGLRLLRKIGTTSAEDGCLHCTILYKRVGFIKSDLNGNDYA